MKKSILLTSLSVLAFTLQACSPSQSTRASSEDEAAVGPTGYFAPETTSAQLVVTKTDQVIANTNQKEQQGLGSLRKKIATMFLVEQFNAKIYGSMKQAIANHPPGGIVYWNPERIGARELAEINSEYSLVAEKNAVGPLLLSTDYEGGGLNKALSGRTVPGIQRFLKGFTGLAHPSWLGFSMEKYGLELCSLHAQIMAKELKQAGINYPLATIADKANNLFIVRGISKNSAEISSCLRKMIDVFHNEKNMIFVTKHFPGLGDTFGDTHDQTVISRAKTKAELADTIKPFRDLVVHANQLERPEVYSILASHAQFKPLDPQNITTVSKPILTQLLRQEMGFKGLVVSDAMWMGEYGKYPTNELLIVYLKSFLAGMDLLMIPGRTFAPGVQYFRQIFDGKLSDEQKQRLESELGLSFQEIQKQFITRLLQTSQRMANAKKVLRYAHKQYKLDDYVEPTSLTEKLAQRYQQILSDLGYE